VGVYSKDPFYGGVYSKDSFYGDVYSNNVWKYFNR